MCICIKGIKNATSGKKLFPCKNHHSEASGTGLIKMIKSSLKVLKRNIVKSLAV
jgi:hypothetical protein